MGYGLPEETLGNDVKAFEVGKRLQDMSNSTYNRVNNVKFFNLVMIFTELNW